jgi:Cu-Zn family superoxide dismutase
MLAALLAVGLSAGGAAVAAADHGSGKDGNGVNATEKLFTLMPDPTGNPEGVAFDKVTKTFYVSITGDDAGDRDGAIYRGTLGNDTVAPFIPGGAGKSAVGIKVRRGKLYVAGGATGTITVYDLSTGAAVATFETGTGGFLNDLVVTGRGDVYVTDSFRPTLWRVTADQVTAGTGTPQALDVSAIPYEPGQFNVNGIVRHDDRRLVVVDSNSGKLFRIGLTADRAGIRKIDEIEGANVPGGDGLLLDRGRLVAVQGNPAQLSFLKLRRAARRATLERTQTSDKLAGPSTVARARGYYLVVNADFATSTKPFHVVGLPRHHSH